LQIDNLGSGNSEFAVNIDFIPAKDYCCIALNLLRGLTLLWHSFRRHTLWRHPLTVHITLAVHATLAVHTASTKAATPAPESLALSLTTHKALAASTLPTSTLPTSTLPTLALASASWAALPTLAFSGFSCFAALFHKLTHLSFFGVTQLAIMVCVKALSHFLHELLTPLTLSAAHALTASSSLPLTLATHELALTLTTLTLTKLSLSALALPAHSLAHALTEATAKLSLALTLSTHELTLSLTTLTLRYLTWPILTVATWWLELTHIRGLILCLRRLVYAQGDKSDAKTQNLGGPFHKCTSAAVLILLIPTSTLAGRKKFNLCRSNYYS
jgi:hypothetical protein